jgi:hypothetical protein
MDVEAIPLGTNFEIRMREPPSVAVLPAVIGPTWLDARDGNGNRRLDNPIDFMRMEIAAALQRNVPVISTLLDGAPVPKAGQQLKIQSSNTRAIASKLWRRSTPAQLRACCSKQAPQRRFVLWRLSSDDGRCQPAPCRPSSETFHRTGLMQRSKIFGIAAWYGLGACILDRMFNTEWGSLRHALRAHHQLAGAIEQAAGEQVQFEVRHKF